MARKLFRLTARKVVTINKPGRHADGGNLYLDVSPNGAKSWTFMFRWRGRQRELGFGSERDVTLARARDLAAAARAQLAQGIEPTSLKRSSGGTTFGEVADEVIEARRPQWRSETHARQWKRSVEVDCQALRSRPVAEIVTEDVLSVLKPLWLTARASGERTRGRIEAVLSYAKAKGWRTGENPAMWRGHLDQLLSKRKRIEQPHHESMAYEDVPAFMERLRQVGGMTARALEFIILTASRSGEALGSTWDEFNLDAALWTIPGSRMKRGLKHEVPLPPRAVEIIQGQKPISSGDLVFPGRDTDGPISGWALRNLLHERMKVTGATVHGFRSSFRDWAGDSTPFPRDVVEAALAHAIENQTEAAYRRATALKKRRKLMTAWEIFCSTPTAANVVPLRAVKY